MKNPTISYEAVRKMLAGISKFDDRKNRFGLLSAIQDVREIRKLHTYYVGERSEFDHAKYGVWLYPNEDWNEPLFYHVGHGVDHVSGVVKGFTTTVAPSGRDIVRLWRRCVMPKSLWLPPSVQQQALHYDVYGLEDVAAIDNAAFQVQQDIVLMFLTWGTIVLRVPVARGDLKGTVERRNETSRTQFISKLPGYVPSYQYMNPKHYERIKAAAKLKAKLTVLDFTAQYTMYIVQTNHAPHPTLRRPRMEIWRRSQELAPLVIPTGELQLKATFALTYETLLTRLGVQVEDVHFNSATLADLYRTYHGPVFVKLDPDDVREVLVLAPYTNQPIRATLVEHESELPITLEALKFVIAPFKNCTQRQLDAVLPNAFPERLQALRSGEIDTNDPLFKAAAEAATQTAQQDAIHSVETTNDETGKAPGMLSNLSDTFDF